MARTESIRGLSNIAPTIVKPTAAAITVPCLGHGDGPVCVLARNFPPDDPHKEQLGSFKVRTKVMGSFNGCDSSLNLSNLDTIHQVENLLTVN